MLPDLWLAAARARARRGTAPERWENRRRLVDRLAPGRSFLYLGGLWNVNGDVAFHAERAGASRVVLFDGMDPTPEFCDRHRQASSSVTYVQGDLHARVFYPGRSAASERAFARAYGEQASAYPGMTRPFDETPLLGYANMWWGLSRSALRSMLTLRSMLRYSGFEVREEFHYLWSFHDYLAEAIDTPQFVPPLGFCHARGQERLAGLGRRTPRLGA